MVVAALLRTLLMGDCCFCSSNYKLISLNPFYKPKNKQQRQHERRKEWNIWLSSTADDLDLFSDWLFFWVTYNGERGGFEDHLTLLLFIFCCLGTITWSLELMQISCIRPEEGWAWLQILILCVEDIPQLILTLLISGRFSDISPLGLFNVVTSFYSLIIRLAGELFMNCCFCCEPVEDEDNDKPAQQYKNLP